MTVIKRTIWFLIACFALNLLGNEFDDVVKEAAGVVDNLFHDEKVNELFKTRLRREVIQNTYLTDKQKVDLIKNAYVMGYLEIEKKLKAAEQGDVEAQYYIGNC